MSRRGSPHNFVTAVHFPVSRTPGNERWEFDSCQLIPRVPHCDDTAKLQANKAYFLMDLGPKGVNGEGVHLMKRKLASGFRSTLALAA